MSDDRPNIVLVMTDQHRGDCVAFDGHPVLQTPHLDQLARSGFYFRSAYSAHPQCVPGRRTIMTGMSAHGHGVYNNHNDEMFMPTIAGELSRAGYHTHLCGKLHLHPQRKLYGFMSADWADAPHISGGGGDWTGDYGRFLRNNGCSDYEPGMSHGMDCNGWAARPWHLDERLHFTNWVTDSALKFLERRDPTCPFFLKVSYHQPHQPCTPPQAYWDRYIHEDLGKPIQAAWSKKIDHYEPGTPIASWQTLLSDAQMQQFRAGYLGCINHIDDQLGRLMRCLPQNTIILFTADHGEMLGDHQWIRKTRALEGSARIPFILNMPNKIKPQADCVREEAVELMDVMPTLLDCAGVDIAEHIEGQNIMSCLRGESQWRERVHGEIARCGGEDTGMQYLTDGKRKYIWEPGLGRELFFNLENDPNECSPIDTSAPEIDSWRNDLISRLKDRAEGFVKDGKLVKLAGATPVRRETLPRAPYFD